MQDKNNYGKNILQCFISQIFIQLLINSNLIKNLKSNIYAINEGNLFNIIRVERVSTF